jgi:hypothetical protein
MNSTAANERVDNLDDSSRAVADASSVEILTHKFLFFCFILPINALIIPFFVSYLCLTVTLNISCDLFLRFGIRPPLPFSIGAQSYAVMTFAGVFQLFVLILAGMKAFRRNKIVESRDQSYQELQGKEGGDLKEQV